MHSGLAGKGDHKHHRKVSRKQRGVITLDSGCRGRRGKALKGFLYQTASVLTPDGLSRPLSLVIWPKRHKTLTSLHKTPEFKNPSVNSLFCSVRLGTRDWGQIQVKYQRNVNISSYIYWDISVRLSLGEILFTELKLSGNFVIFANQILSCLNKWETIRA